jgi:hypothetical protein
MKETPATHDSLTYSGMALFAPLPKGWSEAVDPTSGNT